MTKKHKIGVAVVLGAGAVAGVIYYMHEKANAAAALTSGTTVPSSGGGTPSGGGGTSSTGGDTNVTGGDQTQGATGGSTTAGAGG